MKALKWLLILALLIYFSCGNDENEDNADYKQGMRNGHELVTDNGDTDGNPLESYLNSIDGAGREDLFFGYDDDDQATPKIEADYMMVFIDICEQNDVEVLVTDYCFTQGKMDESYTRNNVKDYISFAAPERELNVIPDYPPEPYNTNTNDINSLADAKNFLYLLNTENFTSKQNFISAISETNYDVLIIDFFFDEEEYTTSEIEALKTKRNGGKRLVISYISIGEAEDYRYYWKNEWISNPPVWLAGENPDWEGNYKVRYWHKEWQDIIYGSESSYIYKIIITGFDGAYLDIIDAFEYFE